jgi:copper transport protein
MLAAWPRLLGAVILLGSTLSAATASGHAVPATMDPPPNASLDLSPREVVIRFTERVEARPSTLEVLDGGGRSVAPGPAVVDPADPWRYRVALPALPDGAYTVSWRVLSADDGHVTSGAHVFTIGVPGPAPVESGATLRSGAGWRPVARWLVALGGALLLGALVAAPLLGLGPSRGLAGMEALGMTVVAISGTLDLALQDRELGGGRPITGSIQSLLTTAPGLVWLARGALVGLLAILVAARSLRRRPAGGLRRISALVAAALVMAGGLVSHAAAAGDDRWLILGAECLHLLAVASWLGGLVCFATVFWRAGQIAGAVPDAERLMVAIPAFSRLAALAVGILAVTGFLLARLHLADWGELAGTAYGRWVAAKVLVFTAMLALGAWHQGRTAPRARPGAGGRRTDEERVVRVPGTVRLEAALGLVALGLAGILAVTMPPARSGPPPPTGSPGSLDHAAPAGFRHERDLDAARVRLEIAPLRPGPNRIRLAVTDPSGAPLADATAALVQVTPVDAGIGPVTFQLDREAPGVFVAPSAVLGLVGRWSGRLVVQRTNAYDVNDRFELTVAEAHVAHPAGLPDAPARRGAPFDRVTGGVALAAFLMTLAIFLRSRRQLAAAQRFLAHTPMPPAAEPAAR